MWYMAISPANNEMNRYLELVWTVMDDEKWKTFTAPVEKR